MAVKVCASPRQLGFVPVVNPIEILGVTSALRVSVMLFDVLVAAVAQTTFDVNTHVTTSKLDNALEL